MKNFTVFTIFFAASWFLGATPIIIGVFLVYGIAWLLARNSRPAPPSPPPPTFGNGSRKLHL
jgi:hypothetical protein